MKSKTIWILCLVMMLLGYLLIDVLNKLVGIIIIGLFGYIAGGYQIKTRLEKVNEPKGIPKKMD